MELCSLLERITHVVESHFISIAQVTDENDQYFVSLQRLIRITTLTILKVMRSLSPGEGGGSTGSVVSPERAALHVPLAANLRKLVVFSNQIRLTVAHPAVQLESYKLLGAACKSRAFFEHSAMSVDSVLAALGVVVRQTGHLSGEDSRQTSGSTSLCDAIVFEVAKGYLYLSKSHPVELHKVC